MRITAEELLNQRLQCDEQILATLDTHVTRLEAARNEALLALTAAQESLSLIEVELDDVKTRRASLVQNVKETRHRLRPRPMDVFPLELLRLIFLELSASPKNLWPNEGHGTVDLERARRPFHLAGVCRRWRDLALAIPTLWSYIGVPAPGLQPERRSYYYLYWVTTLLDRSKPAPLDICLPWAGDPPWENESYSDRLMDTLAEHSLRWRHFEFALPRRWLDADMMSQFRRPTPLLETFYLTGRSSETEGLEWDAETSIPRYLPACSRLAHFRSDYTNVLYAVPRPPLACIRTIQVTIKKFPCRVLWDILRGAPALELLRMAFVGDNADDLEEAPDGPVHLPCLRELHISSDVCLMFAAAPNSLSFPGLTTLGIDPGSVGSLHAFFESCAQGVTRLSLTDGDVVMDDAALLRPLRNLQELQFTECTLKDDFLQALAVPDEWLLPRLEIIKFDACVVDPEDGDGLAHIVRARNLASQSDRTSAPSRIRAVVIDSSSDVPAWLVAEVRYLLAEDVVVPVDPDPVIEDITLDDPHESEAEFTDGGGSSTGESESSFELASGDAGDDGTDESDEDEDDSSEASSASNNGEPSGE